MTESPDRPEYSSRNMKKSLINATHHATEKKHPYLSKKE